MIHVGHAPRRLIPTLSTPAYNLPNSAARHHPAPSQRAATPSVYMLNIFKFNTK